MLDRATQLRKLAMLQSLFEAARDENHHSVSFARSQEVPNSTGENSLAS